MDNKLKDLFSNYSPQISSDEDFMRQLEKNLDAVEIVREQLLRSKINKRMAMIAAAVAGFISGAVTMACYSWISSLSLIRSMSTTADVIIWLIIASACTLIALVAYDITLTVTKVRENQSLLDSYRGV